MSEQRPERIVTVSTKSTGVAILLTILFGPIGMFYATIPGAIIMLIIGIAVGFVTGGLGLPVVWIVSIIWGVSAVKSYNRKIIEGQREY